MNAIRIAGAVILILGILALVYGGFTYTKQTHKADLGPIELKVRDEKRVDIPVWAGVIAVVAGGGLLLFGGPGRKTSG